MILPAIHHLISLRQQIAGTKGKPLVAGGRASQLRASKVPGFGDLTPREAEVCYLLIGGSLATGLIEDFYRTPFDMS